MVGPKALGLTPGILEGKHHKQKEEGWDDLEEPAVLEEVSLTDLKDGVRGVGTRAEREK